MLIYLIGIGVVLLAFALNMELMRRALIDLHRMDQQDREG